MKKIVKVFETLIYAVRTLCRPPDRKRKLIEFGIFAAAVFCLAQLFAVRIETAYSYFLWSMLVFLVRWSWIPLIAAFLLIRHGELRIRKGFERFFRQIAFASYDGSFPQYQRTERISDFVSILHFESRAPLERWLKLKSDLEMFLKKKISIIKQSEKEINKMEVRMIRKQLPKRINWKDDFLQGEKKFAAGVNHMGQVIWDASTVSHALIAGSTNSGKTNTIRCIIRQAFLKRFNVLVIDMKNGGDYVDLEKEFLPFVESDPKEISQLLLALELEVKSRLAQFKEKGVANLDEFNALGGKLPPWLVVIDEAAELFDVKPKDKAEKELYSEIDSRLRTLARLSRAAGVHLLMGFIRPDADVLSGQIKNNLLFRVCGYFADASVSRIVLGNDAATQLPQNIKGRFIVNGEEMQAYYLPGSKPVTD